MNRWEIALALWGEQWTTKLWPLIRGLPVADLIEVLPRYCPYESQDGHTYAHDVNAAYRAGLLDRLLKAEAHHRDVLARWGPDLDPDYHAVLRDFNADH